MISFDHETCRNLESALRKEWLETNGLGGFASSTIIGLNTRRYHGLLTAATRPPVGRMVLLSKLEEALVVAGNRYELSTNQYPGVIHYELKAAGQMATDERVLEMRPLIAFRDYHSTTHENGALNPRVEVEPNLATVRPYDGVPSLHLAHNADDLDVNGCWYRNFEYQVERERGLDFREDLFTPCALKFDLSRHGRAAIIASTERRDINRVFDYRQAEINRRQAILGIYPDANELVRTLAAAADQYIVARRDQKTVIAGYHWFSDWGRDTMIALPGLTLVTGRDDAAKSILLAFARFVDRGMLPNRFPDAGEEPEYNTVDATLWYFEAVRAL